MESYKPLTLSSWKTTISVCKIDCVCSVHFQSFKVRSMTEYPFQEALRSDDSFGYVLPLKALQI